MPLLGTEWFGKWKKTIHIARTLASGHASSAEAIIRRRGRLISEDIGFSKLVLTAGWYIWWERRQKMHGENVQTPFRSALSIIVLSQNYMIAKNKPNAK
jgi:hypothetical protein